MNGFRIITADERMEEQSGIGGRHLRPGEDRQDFPFVDA